MVRLGLALSTVMNAWNVINMIAAAILVLCLCINSPLLGVILLFNPLTPSGAAWVQL